MDNYTYNPVEPDEINETTDEINYSTSLNELDTIELLNRNADNYQGNQVITPDNPYPDILKKPLFMNTVRQGGILKKGPSNKKVTFAPTKFSEMNVSQLANNISESLINILNDLLNFNGTKEEFLNIFTKDNRLLAIGVLFVIISLFILFFINTNEAVKNINVAIE